MTCCLDYAIWVTRKNDLEVNMNRRIILLALVPLLLLEIALVIFESELSGDVAQSKSVQSDIRALVTQDSGLSVLVVGNSVVGEAIDAALLEATLDIDAKVLKVVPDGSNIWEWYCILSNASRANEDMPDLIIVAFTRNWISDQSNLDITRSFGYACDLGNLGEVSQFSDVSFEDKLQAIAVKISSTYRLRDRIRNGLLNVMIPNYTLTLQRLNSATNDRQGKQSMSPISHVLDDTYFAVRTLTSKENLRESKFVFLAMPVRDEYKLGDGICAALRGPNSTLVDMRGHVQLGSQHFRDSMHLNSIGRNSFTLAFAGVLSSNESHSASDSTRFNSCNFRPADE